MHCGDSHGMTINPSQIIYNYTCTQHIHVQYTTHTYEYHTHVSRSMDATHLQSIQLQRTAEGHTASLLNKGRRRSWCSKCFRGLSSSKTRLVLYRGSFFLVASIILIAGGIGSHFKLPLAEGNTTNTTSCGEGSMPNTTVLFSSGLPDNGDTTMASLLPLSSPLPLP